MRLPKNDLDWVINSVDTQWEALRNQRLLITGGTGFIGKWLLGTFLHANRTLGLSAQVAVLSRWPERFLEDFPELSNSSEIMWLRGDVRDFDLDAVKDCTFVIHAATDVVVSSTPSEILETCYIGTRRVLESMMQGSCTRRMLLLSSGAVYGHGPRDGRAIPEDWLDAPNPLTTGSAYGEGKRLSELLCAIASSMRPSLEVSIARCFAFVGPHMPLDKHFAIGNFIDAAMRSEDIFVQGDGTPLRSYLYAADLAIWLWTMLFRAQGGRAYNVGGTEKVSIRELAYRVNQTLGGAGEIKIAHAPRPDAVPNAYVPRLDRIATELGLVPTVGLDEAIMRTARWAEYGLHD